MSSITDLVIRIKNGYLAHRETISTPLTRYSAQVLEKLVEQGYVKSYEVETDGPKKSATIHLSYEGTKSRFTDVRIASKPGQRMYVSASKIPTVLNGLGLAVLSTPKGIMSGKEARKAGTGGELLFTIW